MTEVGISAKGESHPKEPGNIEEDNIRDGEIWVNMNATRNDILELLCH